ncbi:hypothetical protein OUZ56_020019 [Daphnia magna]|uniref:Uncharacterized protein n=1 Tax=Daphnia magna TaxID=35525 RepID=A0ABQ9ZDB7_9CRUS|nr:hypothetical protein OUZ56_020019 [Daphnia magna]
MKTCNGRHVVGFACAAGCVTGHFCMSLYPGNSSPQPAYMYNKETKGGWIGSAAADSSSSLCGKMRKEKRKTSSVYLIYQRPVLCQQPDERTDSTGCEGGGVPLVQIVHRDACKGHAYLHNNETSLIIAYINPMRWSVGEIYFV